MKFNGLYSSFTPTIQELVLSITHLAGTNTYVRVGGSYANNNTQPGLFSPNYEKAHTAASHGKGTAYCGKIFKSYCGVNPLYSKSTGIGGYFDYDGVGHIDRPCISQTDTNREYAHCYVSRSSGQCPNGWGSYYTFLKYRPGCCNGTYYPNPTPASNTDIYTGSL